MGAICFGSVGLGLLVGFFFSLLFISFDATWKKTLSAIFASGAGGVGLWGIFERYGITDYSEVFTSIGIFSVSFLMTFIIFMVVLCKIMKDKDDTDVLRIRDILLGQKKYVQKYYEKREREIDEKLNIPALEKRENEVHIKEQHLNAQREVFEREREEFNRLTEGKLKIKLPEKKNLTVTKEFLDLFPSYVEDLAAFIEGIKKESALFLEAHTSVDYEAFRVFLTLISVQILEHLFGKGAKDVRIHFRYYDEKKNGYKKLVSVIGGKEYKRDLTFIPYDKANMIIKSFECKRALIKSHNFEYDYAGNNSTTWTEYMTGAFYNITRKNKPCLSFGISVKNAAKFKNLFNFLNYCKFESYLQEIIEQFNDCHKIEKVLYPEHKM